VALENIKADLRRFYIIEASKENPGIGKKLYVLFENPGLQALIVYRFGVWLKSLKVLLPLRLVLEPVYWLLHWSLIVVAGIRINRNTRIGKGLYIGHFGGIEIGGIEIGENCSIHQHVKIGIRGNAGTAGEKIGNEVWIGAHSRIQGNIMIGDGATISAGSTVLNDVKDHALVVGNPARMVVQHYENRKLLAI